jgi:hypothetical protein
MRIASVPQGARFTGAFVMLFSSRARLTVLALPLAALAVGALEAMRILTVVGARLTTWTTPFHDLVMTAVSILGVGSTYHISFDCVGLPGLQFLQDRVGGTGGHTNLDFVDTLPAEDLTKNATIVASFAYHAAMADTKVPRKPLRPQGGAR